MNDPIAKMIFSVVLVALCICQMAAGAQPDSATTAPAQSRPAQPDAKIKAIVESYVQSGSNHGLVVGLFIDGRTRVYGFGSSAIAEGGAPDGKTLFEIGSITKVFTTSLLAQMADEKMVQLDEPLQDLLPEGVRVPDYKGEPIRLEHLATHTSGLPRLADTLILHAVIYSENPYARYKVRQMYDFLDRYKLNIPVGRHVNYSNLGMGLLGHALALRCDTSYEQAVVERICRPLGMADTRINLTPEQKSRLAQGHGVDGRPVPHWDIPALAGCGALRSTAEDLLKFVAANLGYPASPLARAMAKCHKPRHTIRHENMQVGLGWIIGSLDDGRPVIWHNGGTGGFRSWLGFVRRTRTGVVVLSNSANGVDHLGWQIIDLVNDAGTD